MKNIGSFLGLVGFGLLSWVGCGGGGDDIGLSGGVVVTTGTGTGGRGGDGGEGTGGDGTGGTGGSGTGGSGAGGTPMVASDPNKDGPYTIVEIDDPDFTVQATGDDVPIHCAYPTSGPTDGPYPVIVVAHGFQLPANQYNLYLRRLASFGYVALTADFPTSFLGTNNTEAAQNIIAGLDWVAARPDLKGDTNLAGATGHSLGGKLAVHAAKIDARIKATIVLDPVDGAPGPTGGTCNPPACIDVSAELPIPKPTGFLGELTDKGGGFGQACAPEAENFLTFYANASAPSFAVTVNGANHMSFLDNVSTCGFTCGVCQMATVDNATVNSLARAYVVAFYERHLRGNTAYDTYLTGAEAKTRYVDTNLVTIQTK
jgi:dienelactone hydrolase